MRLADLAGIGRKMPLTMTAFTVAGFGLVGMPGTAGFISKWYLALGALDKGWWVLVFLIVASSLIALVYVGRVLEVAWLREPSPAIAQASDPPLSMLLPLVVLAAATIYFGFDTELTAGIAGTAAKAPARGAAMTAACRPRASFSWRCSSPFVGALLIPLFRSAAEPARDGDAGDRGRSCASPCSACSGRCSPAPGRKRRSSRSRPGLDARVQGRAARHAVRAVASSLWIVNSLYSIGYMRANDEPRQTRFYVCFALALGSTIGHRLRQEPVHAVPVLRGADALDLSAGDAQGRTRKPFAPAASISCCCSARRCVLFLPAIIATWVLAGTLDFTPGGILAGKAGAPRHRRAARALRVRHRQGGGDAAAFLAAGGDGRADAGQRAAARGGGGQGRRVHDPQGGRLIFGIDTLSVTGPVRLADGRRRARP